MPRPERAPRVALVEWLEPLSAPGHWVPDQVAAAGGRSVLGSAAERSRESSWDTVAGERPEVIVLALCGFDLPHTLAEWDRWRPPQVLRETPAWRQGQLWAIDGSAYTSRPGPRLVDGVEILSAILTGPCRSARRPPAHGAFTGAGETVSCRSDAQPQDMVVQSDGAPAACCSQPAPASFGSDRPGLDGWAASA